MPTSSSELVVILERVLDSLTVETFDESVDKLRFFFPDTLLLGALDLIDRDSVIAYKTPWGRPQYEVLGSTTTYAVFPGLPSARGHASAYCTCPAYAYSVLLSQTQLMCKLTRCVPPQCKHVLATLLALRLSKCVERPVSADDLANIIARQCKL